MLGGVEFRFRIHAAELWHRMQQLYFVRLLLWARISGLLSMPPDKGPVMAGLSVSRQAARFKIQGLLPPEDWRSRIKGHFLIVGLRTLV